MARIEIDFVWERDEAGYRLVDAEPSRAQPTVHPVFGVPVQPSPLAAAGKPQRVVARGGKRLLYRPLSRFDRLCTALARVKEPDQVWRFIQQYGPLTRVGLDPDYGEAVPLVLDSAANLRDWLHANNRDRRRFVEWIGTDGTPIARLRASVVADASGTLAFRIVPESLLSAVWLQLAVMLTEGEKTLRACRHCGMWFWAGRGTKRRLDAQFCSDKHRVTYNSLKRSD